MRKTEIPRTRGVTAVLGPTNTGKTHLAIERMLGHQTGLIGLPLRLLAREVYDKIVAKIGAEHVALITGEEKIKPPSARYWVCTVEAMPRELTVDFVAVDEIQLAADPERGHVFTDRLLHARGAQETLLLGAQTMRDAINDLLPGANHVSRPRFSKLSYAGSKKLSRLPRRTAIVAFSANEVYAIAELMRRQRGGAAVVLGALSPRTRNAQVALYQSGDVDFMIATDAVGMGINLDVDHVAFAGVRKFDGHTHRELTPGEMGQIAGRAGRHLSDGTFGVSGEVETLSPDLVDRLETHNFEPVRVLQWRNRDLDFGSLEKLKASMKESPDHVRLQRARMSDDAMALEHLSQTSEIAEKAYSTDAVKLLWDVCQVPDYRKISNANHSEMLGDLFKFLVERGSRIPEDWFAAQVGLADRTDGDIDTLANRIAHIRTWTFVSNRAAWLERPEHWQGVTREVEDKLSDALHECLTERFVDRRTSVLMRKLNDKDELFGEITDDGAIHVEKHFVGRLKGFRFFPDLASTEGVNGKAARNAAAHVVARELDMRARRVASARPDAFKLTRKATIEWRGDEIARLERTEDPLKPMVRLIADETLTGPDQEKVQKRLDEWVGGQVEERLKPLVMIARAEDVAGLARGIAFRLTENFGILKRELVAEEIRTLDQEARAQLRRYGVRFGAFNIYFPLLLKPASADLLSALWALRNGAESGIDLAKLPEPPRAGLTSVPIDPTVPEAFYRAYGFHVCGPRAVRVDMLERLADLIRPLTAFRASEANPTLPPKGATGNGGFTIIPEMMSIMGCSSEELGAVLKSLGFWVERRPKKKAPVAVVQLETASPANAGETSGALDEAAPASTATDPTQDETPSNATVGVSTVEGTATLAGDGAVVPAAADQPSEDQLSLDLPAVDSAPAHVAAAPAGSAVAEPYQQPQDQAVQPDTSVVSMGGEKGVEEPEFEDVWRPRKRYSQDNRERPRNGPREGRPDRGAERTGGRDASPNSRRRDQPSRPAINTATAAGGTPPAKADDARNGEGERKRQGGGPDRRERPNDRPTQQQRRPDRDNNRGPKRRDDANRDRDRGGFKLSTESKRKEADPDSPFAALSKLKAALEKRAEGDKST